MNRFLMMLAAVLSVVILCAGIHPAGAQTPPKMVGSKMAVKKTYYVCAKCKVYYSEAAAKKAGYKDAMGHKLTKSATIPKGYKDGAAMKKPAMAGKMDSKSKM